MSEPPPQQQQARPGQSRTAAQRAREMLANLAHNLAHDGRTQAVAGVNFAADAAVKRALARRAPLMAMKATTPLLLFDVASTAVDIWWDPFNFKHHMNREVVEELNRETQKGLTEQNQAVVDVLNAEYGQQAIASGTGLPMPAVVHHSEQAFEGGSVFHDAVADGNAQGYDMTGIDPDYMFEEYKRRLNEAEGAADDIQQDTTEHINQMVQQLTQSYQSNRWMILGASAVALVAVFFLFSSSESSPGPG